MWPETMGGLRFLLFLACVALCLRLGEPLAQYQEPRNYAVYAGGDIAAGVAKWNDRKAWVQLPTLSGALGNLERGAFAQNVSVKSIVANKSSEMVYFGGVFEDVGGDAQTRARRDEVQTVRLSCLSCRHEVQVVSTSGNSTMRSKVQVVKSSAGWALPSVSSGTASPSPPPLH